MNNDEPQRVFSMDVLVNIITKIHSQQYEPNTNKIQ